MRTTAILAVLNVLLPLSAQEAAAPAAPALPAAGTPAATALVDTAIAKLQAYGRGTFRSTESHDIAMLRGAGIPVGTDDTLLDGGWQQDLVWGNTDDDHYVRRGGRMVTKVGDTWKLRAKKLGSGRPVPFTLDPELLCSVLQGLPAAARRVEHVEAGTVRDRQVAVLSLAVDNDLAAEFIDSGAMPEVGGGFGGVFVIGGFGNMQLPQPECAVYLALSIDPENGDLLRFAVKVYEKTGGFGTIQVQVQGAGGGQDEEEVTDADDAKEGEAKPEWKCGLPTRKPGKEESVLTYQVDFGKPGFAAAPELPDAAKQLLRLR